MYACVCVPLCLGFSVYVDTEHWKTLNTLLLPFPQVRVLSEPTLRCFALRVSISIGAGGAGTSCNYDKEP